jgi:phospholipid transport system substrate-binding protein
MARHRGDLGLELQRPGSRLRLTPNIGGAALGRRRVLGAALAALFVVSAVGAPGPAAAPSTDAARDLVQNVGTDVLAVLRDNSLSDEAKFQALVDLLSGPIDLDLVARLILARHWRTANQQQQVEYLKLFREYALDTLASKLHLYQGQDFEVTGASAVGDHDALVTTRILNDGGPPLQVDWRLRELKDGDLVAIDVIVEGVSLIVSLRSEFGSVVERQGMDGLLAELRQRLQREA